MSNPLPRVSPKVWAEWEKKLAGLSLHSILSQHLQDTTDFTNGEPHFQYWQWDCELDGSIFRRNHLPLDGEYWQGMSLVPSRPHHRKRPDWTLDDSKIRTYLESRYPNWRNNPTELKRAARVAALLYLAFRVGLPNPELAEALGLTEGTAQLKVVKERQRADKFFQTSDTNQTETAVRSREQTGA